MVTIDQLTSVLAAASLSLALVLRADDARCCYHSTDNKLTTALIYALRSLRSTHGIPDTSLHDVFRATVIAKLTYCAPSWSGACSAADRAKLESFVSRCKRLEYCSSEVPTYSDLTDEADDILFSRIMTNHGHVLQPLLPDRLRERSHNKTLLNRSTHLNNDDFLKRMLYKDSY